MVHIVLPTGTQFSLQASRRGIDLRVRRPTPISSYIAWPPSGPTIPLAAVAPPNVERPLFPNRSVAKWEDLLSTSIPSELVHIVR